MPQTNNFTIVRLILATLVVFGHFKTLPAISHPYGIHSYADFAVDAFFIVSGYLVYGSFDNMPKLKGFYIKRFFRIYPLYLIMILLQAFIMFILLGGNVELKSVFKYLGSNLIFANFLSPAMGGLLDNAANPAINASLWTLKIEVMFYLIVPLIWWFLGKTKTIGIALIFIASTVFYLVTSHYGMETLSKQLPAQMRFFVMGIAIYVLLNPVIRKAKAQDLRHVKINIILTIILFTICTYRHDIPYFSPVYPLVLGMLVYICVLRLPVINLKYDISYGVYLIHAPLIQISVVLGLFQDTTNFLMLLLLTVFILAYFAEKFIEVPMVKLGKKYAK